MHLRPDLPNDSRCPESSDRAKYPWHVRSYLFWRGIARLLLRSIDAAAFRSDGFQQGRTRQDKDGLLTARALSQEVDNLIQKTEALSFGLATGRALAQGDLASFHKQARKTFKEPKLVVSIILVDKPERQVMNTLKEFGEHLALNLETGCYEWQERIWDAPRRDRFNNPCILPAPSLRWRRVRQHWAGNFI